MVHLRALEAVNTECRLRVSRNLHASKGVLDNTGRYERRAPLGARRFASGRDDLEYRAARAKENFKECSRTAGDSVEYAYNALGELVRRKTDGVVDRHFLWDNGQLLALLDGSGNRIAEYAYLPNGEPLSYTTSGGTDYYHVDLRGNVVGVSTGTAVVQQTNYAPWGAVENQTGWSFDSTRLGWKGDVWEGGKTNLYYVRNRWYDPVSRGFISEDPIGIAGGMNTYAYGGNDPINIVDVTGLSADLCVWHMRVSAADNSWSYDYYEEGSCPQGRSDPGAPITVGNEGFNDPSSGPQDRRVPHPLTGAPAGENKSRPSRARDCATHAAIFVLSFAGERAEVSVLDFLKSYRGVIKAGTKATPELTHALIVNGALAPPSTALSWGLNHTGVSEYEFSSSAMQFTYDYILKNIPILGAGLELGETINACTGRMPE